MSIEVRSCTDADVAGVVALIEDRIGAEDAPEAQLVLDDPRFDRNRWSVAVDGDDVVSTMGTFPMHANIGVATIAASMVEFVATKQGYEGRGLIRRQFDYHHADVKARGEFLQVIVGITYFYRRFGYEYAIPVASWRSIEEPPVVVPGIEVRTATPDDVQDLQRLRQASSWPATVSLSMSNWLLESVVVSPVYDTFIAEREGAAVGSARLYQDGDKPFVMDLSATERPVAEALLAGIGERCSGQAVTMLDRPGITKLLDGIGVVGDPTGESYYSRSADVVALLNAIRPELDRRLAESDLKDASGATFISNYGSSVNLSYDAGKLEEFTIGGAVHGPLHLGGCGVPPDLMTSLVVGPLGFAGLAERHPDVNGGKQTKLMEILFPSNVADVQSWVIP